MKTARGTECQGNHNRNGKMGSGRWDVYTIAGHRYTVCAHKMGHDGYCGALIDVTDAQTVTICCGNHPSDEPDDSLVVHYR